MDNAKQQLIDKLKTGNNVLVTVSRNPSVDQLAACIGLTLLLNKQGKHAAAVFSGQVPSTLEFLKPEDTLEKNTDSLRDFIIAIDRAKADKLRYKVEDNIVRIFITPYKTSISQEDLEFSEGDFNVDVVITLGVNQQEDMDEAITAHGRILHDATVISINTIPGDGLGSISWYDPQASSLSELITELTQALGDNLLDNQIATALLTGIVSETERFSNDKTSSQTMSASAALMAAGADQQLVASKLEEPEAPISLQGDDAGNDTGSENPGEEDGTLKIDHVNDSDLLGNDSASDDVDEQPGPGLPEIDANDDIPPFIPSEPESPLISDSPSAGIQQGPKLMTEPPSMGGRLTANSTEEALDPTSDPFSLPKAEMPQLLDHKSDSLGNAPSSSSMPPTLPSDLTGSAFTPLPTSWMPPPAPPVPSVTPPPAQPPADDDDKTLTELEQAVDSPHIKTESVDEARVEVKQALEDAAPAITGPIEALGAQPLGGDLHPSPANDTSTPQVTDSTAPPPVPPPIPFQFGNPSPPQPS